MKFTEQELNRLSEEILALGLFTEQLPRYNDSRYFFLKDHDFDRFKFCLDIFGKSWIVLNKSKSMYSGLTTFEKVLDSVPQEIQEQLLFHLDLFM